MIIWFSSVCALLALRIWANTRERRAASALTEYVYKQNVPEHMALMSSLIDHASTMTELMREVAGAFFFITPLVRFVYGLFAYTLTLADARTPHALVLYFSEKKFYQLYDPDVLGYYDDWRQNFFFDAISAFLLFVALCSVLSETLFHYLYG